MMKTQAAGRERTAQAVIVRKYMTFHSRASRLIDRRDAQALRISKEMVEILDELVANRAPITNPADLLIDLPLEKLRSVERLIEDNGLSIPRRIIAIHQLLMSH